MHPETIFTALEVLGVFSFAFSGFFVARKHGLDWVGTFIAAFLAAFGGGTLRDVLLDVRPFYWVQHNYLLWSVLLLSVLAPIALNLTSRFLSQRVIVAADAVGLGIFSATGTQIALYSGWPPLPCVLMGVSTAVCGGLLRDIVCDEKPMLLEDRVPYATCAFVGNWLLLGLLHLGWLSDFWSVAVTAILITGGRLLLAMWGVKLPQFGGRREPFEDNRR